MKLATGKHSKLWFALALVVLLGATALALHFEGRLWICSCGNVRVWIGNTHSSDNSQHILDPYSFTHVLHGVAFFWLVMLLAARLRPRWQFLLAVFAEAAWEVFENTDFIIQRYRDVTAALGYFGDTVVNSLGDILCCIVGFLIARWLGIWRSIVLFVVLEVVLILWIRDSLLLEILMLLAPIDAIRAWQMRA